MRWVVLTDDHPPKPGGVSAFTGRVVGALRSRDHDVAVFARRRPGLPPSVTGVGGPSFGRRGGTWLGLRALGALRRADVVLATTWPVASLAARISAPLLVVAHGSDVTRAPRSPRAFHRIWAHASGRFALSSYLAGRLAGSGIAATVLPAPVRIAGAPVLAASSGRWGLVARATALKGGDRFVRIVAEAGASGVVFGDGPALPRWRALAAQLGADVVFLGNVPHPLVTRALRTLDAVFLLPRCDPDGTGAEGLGLSLVEAAAIGVPAVGCATGGVPEAVGPGLILNDPDDTVASAAVVRRWWTPSRGEEAWAWCRGVHGVDRTVAALDRPGGWRDH